MCDSHVTDHKTFSYF